MNDAKKDKKIKGMTLAQAYSLAEKMAALAVVVSLHYLGIQIKRSRDVAKKERRKTTASIVYK